MMVSNFTLYAHVSIMAALGAIWHAFSTRRQYFPAMFYLATSKVSIAILGNCAFALSLVTYSIIVKVFLGRLREAEVERLTERVYSSLLEICLTLTVFRQDFDAAFAALILALAFSKVLHWLLQDRIDYMQTELTISWLQHIRTVSFLAILLAIDIAAARESLASALESRGGYYILFTFEYAILTLMAAGAAAKYAFTTIDAACGHHWHAKGLATLYLDLFMDAVHCIFYVAFFLVTMRQYVTVPIHLIRDVYVSIVSLARRGSNYLAYRYVASRLGTLEDATAEDVERVGAACIICREDMATTQGLKKLRCGHVFHLACLRSWLERQQTCPICRAEILPRRAPPANTPGRAARLPAAAREAPVRDAPAAAAAAPAREGGNARATRARMLAAARARRGVEDPEERHTRYRHMGRARQGLGDSELSGTVIHRPDGGMEIIFDSLDQLLGQLQFAGGPPLPGPQVSPSGAMTRGQEEGREGAQDAGTQWGLPPGATPEQQAAFAAAAAASAHVGAVLTQAYYPFATPPLPSWRAGRGASSGAAAGGSEPMRERPGQGSSQGQGSAEPGPSRPSEAGCSNEDNVSSSIESRARAAATAAVAASVAAARQLVQGHASSLQAQLEQLDRIEAAALGRGVAPSGDNGERA